MARQCNKKMIFLQFFLSGYALGSSCPGWRGEADAVKLQGMSNPVLASRGKRNKSGGKKPVVAGIGREWQVLNGFFAEVFTLSEPLD